MKGVLVFLVIFLIFLAATLYYAELPPGNTISGNMNVDPTVEYGGFKVKTITSAIFNGVIYGIIVWVIFTIIDKARKRKK